VSETLSDVPKATAAMAEFARWLNNLLHIDSRYMLAHRCSDTEALFNRKRVTRFVNIEAAARRKLVLLHASAVQLDFRRAAHSRNHLFCTLGSLNRCNFSAHNLGLIFVSHLIGGNVLPRSKLQILAIATGII
jgi:hypothetical protein